VWQVAALGLFDCLIDAIRHPSERQVHGSQPASEPVDVLPIEQGPRAFVVVFNLTRFARGKLHDDVEIPRLAIRGVRALPLLCASRRARQLLVTPV
jgi:hypothetical protein